MIDFYLITDHACILLCFQQHELISHFKQYAMLPHNMEIVS